MASRTESDSFGKIKVPSDKYWGASTQRSLKNFKIGKFKVPIEQIHSMAIVKKAAAITNTKFGDLENRIAKAIIKSADEVISGKLDEHFPLVVWQTGSGTQTNMNLNEVIANRANEILGSKLGAKKPVHPNDHVNKAQSTNDTFPTAMHISIAMMANKKLIPAITKLEKTLGKKANQFKDIVKIGRTHLQDATPLTLGQEFSGYHMQVTKCLARIKRALKEIYPLAQGGTAVGTGLNTKKNFDKKIIKELSRITKLPFKVSSNKFSSLAAHDEIVNFSGTLNTAAVCLMKIANDIRFLGSGPRAGYGELILPSNEPGSSIMPGKVNPTQSEAVTMVCVKVIGNHNGITMAGSHGHFELNVFKPLIIHNIVQSIDLISDSVNCFISSCLNGIKADKKKINKYLKESLMLVTALSPIIGYDNASKIAKSAHKNGTTLRFEALKSGLIEEKTFNKVMNPKKMTRPS